MERRADPARFLQRLSTLGDLARVRILRLLEREELSVGELSRALQLPQSTVSRHLKLLHEHDWVRKRSEGTASLYRLVAAGLEPDAADLWQLARAQLGEAATFGEDDRRLAGVIAERRTDSRTFFGRLGGEWDEVRSQLFGDHFGHEALLALLDPDATVVDLGCGTGNVAVLLAPHVGRVIAVDREPQMLEAARTRLGDAKNIEFRQGDLLALPLDDGCADFVIVVLVLHHLEEPLAAVREAARVLRPGGRLLVVDMIQHDREAFRHTMGHRHLGFTERMLARWAKESGLALRSFRHLPPDTLAKGPGLFAAIMMRGA